MGYAKVSESIVSLRKKGDTVEGYFISTEHDKGKRKNSAIHTIKNIDGKGITRFWGSAAMDRQLAALTPGTRFKLEMTERKEIGEGEAKTSVKLFDLSIWEEDKK